MDKNSKPYLIKVNNNAPILKIRKKRENIDRMQILRLDVNMLCEELEIAKRLIK